MQTARKLELNDFKIVFESDELVIHSEGGDTVSRLYNLKNPTDLTILKKNANFQDFILESPLNPYPDLLVFENNRYNFGIIANQTIKKNQIVCEYLGELASLDAATNPRIVKNKLKNFYSGSSLDKVVDSHIKRISDYAFEITAKRSIKDTVLAHNKRSIAAFINHNTTDPNISAAIINNVIYYKSTRPIQKGEQLIIDYGPDYDYLDRLYYIPSSENHMRPGKWLADNMKFYHKSILQLNPTQQKVLKTTHKYVILPNYFFQLLFNKTLSKSVLLDYEKRLPIIEIADYIKNKNNQYHLFIPSHQQNITQLIFATACKNTVAIETLIKKLKVDVFAKTLQDSDALLTAIHISETNTEFMSIAAPILKKFISSIDRIDALGSDDFMGSALHLLVKKQWIETICSFNKPFFFEVIDENGFDPFVAAIAYGKPNALKELLKIKYVKKFLRKLLFTEDEHHDAPVIIRALQSTPKDQLDAIRQHLISATLHRPVFLKELLTYLF